jgi:nucleotide-binding universal stress UspA family protein
MKSVLACLDLDDSARATALAAGRLAALSRAATRRVHVVERSERIEPLLRVVGLPLLLVGGEPKGALLEEAARPDVVSVVVGLRAARNDANLGSVPRAIACQTGKPLLVVPPAFDVTRVSDQPRVLLPLDGAFSTSKGAQKPVGRLVKAGARVRVLHVFDSPNVPRFWDHAEYDAESWSREFLARHCDLPGAECMLARGSPAELVLDTARSDQSDVIALIWSRDMGDGKADVVRAVLRETKVPVLLIPAPSAPAT